MLGLKSQAIRWFKYFVYSISVLYILVWLLSPFVFNSVISDVLEKEHGLELSSSTGIRYNPFTSHLTISKLEVLKSNQVVFAIEGAEIELRIHRFFFDEIYASEFDVTGIYVNSLSDNELLEVAGIDFSKGAVDVESDEVDTQDIKTESSPKNKNKYKIVVPRILFSDTEFEHLLFEEKHSFNIDELSISDVLVSQDEQRLALGLSGDLNGASIVLETGFGLMTNNHFGDGEGSLEIAIRDFDFEKISGVFKRAGIEQAIQGKMNINTAFDFSSVQAELLANFSETEVLLNKIKITGTDLLLEQEEIKLVLESAVSQLNFSKKSILNELSVPKTILELGKAQIAQPGKLAVLDKIKIEIEPTLFKEEMLQIDSVSVGMQGGSFDIAEKNRNLKSSVKNDEIAAAAKPVNKSLEKQVSTNPATSHFAFRVDQFNLSETGVFIFSDNSVSPQISKKIVIGHFALSNLDSSKLEQRIDFSIDGLIDQYTKFKFKGDAKPFTSNVNVSIVGGLTELSLPNTNGYVHPLLGFDFESGELDTKVELQIVESEINGSTEVFIKGLTLSSPENHNQDVVTEQTSLPLNVALGMLKDDDDNVELDIPMMGNLNSPTFGFGSFISLITKKAIQSAATSYLVKTFIPYAEILSVTMSAGDFILKTRFEDLKYDKGQVELSEQQQPFMNQFIALMKDKKDTQVKVCAISTMVDTATASTSKDEKIAELYKLSTLRMNAFKAFAVKNEVESSRILLCKPQIDLDDKSAGRIEISI
jgi:hypothetical protein